MNFVRALIVIFVTLVATAPAHADLQERDIGNSGTTNAFYDTGLNITWLRNADMNGAMDWTTAMSWATLV